MAARPDIGNKVIHFTRAPTYEDALDLLLSIVTQGRLVGGTGTIRGGYRCVCFTEAPLPVMATAFMNADSFARYSPFGLMFEKSWIYAKGHVRSSISQIRISSSCQNKCVGVMCATSLQGCRRLISLGSGSGDCAVRNSIFPRGMQYWSYPTVSGRRSCSIYGIHSNSSRPKPIQRSSINQFWNRCMSHAHGVLSLLRHDIESRIRPLQSSRFDNMSLESAS